MRQLTQPEIENAPEWADSYFENIIGDMWYVDSKTGRSKSVDTSSEVKSLDSCHYAYRQSKPIPRKEFDITKYKFSDNGISHSFITYSGLFLNCDDGITLSKKDIVAMAKAVKLTAEDLK